MLPLLWPFYASIAAICRAELEKSLHQLYTHQTVGFSARLPALSTAFVCRSGVHELTRIPILPRLISMR
jgi:hypothetical protein